MDDLGKLDNQSVSLQYSTFTIADRLYGIEVKQVQEVVMPMPLTQVPLAPPCIKGLINLRGQVATAIVLRELFKLGNSEKQDAMNVVCRVEENLIALLVDDVGDVVDVAKSDFETTPKTIPSDVRRYMTGVYKTPDSLLSVIDVDSILNYLNTHVA